jgi:hypothetical protein
MTIRFCIVSQYHLAETEPQQVSRDDFIEIQLRRRTFWCAYAIDRAVCSTFDFPCSIPDDNITVAVGLPLLESHDRTYLLQMFDNVDDDHMVSSWESGLSLPPIAALTSYTNIMPALHVIASRQIESEIQGTMLRKTFVPESNVAFRWRSATLAKLQDWNRISKNSPDPFRKGYVSLPWLEMIYYYHIISLFRPTKVMAPGIAGDWSVHSCCQALILFRKFQMAREIAQPWLGVR